MKKANLQSSTQELGKHVTEIIHFRGGDKLTFTGIDTESVQDGAFCKMDRKNGSRIMINTKNVNCVEVFKE